MRRWMLENPKKGVLGVVTTAVGIGMCAKYGVDAASRLFATSTYVIFYFQKFTLKFSIN